MRLLRNAVSICSATRSYIGEWNSTACLYLSPLLHKATVKCRSQCANMNHNIYHAVESKHRISQLCICVRTFNTQQRSIKQKLKCVLKGSLIFVFSTFLPTRAYDGYLKSGLHTDQRSSGTIYSRNTIWVRIYDCLLTAIIPRLSKSDCDWDVDILSVQRIKNCLCAVNTKTQTMSFCSLVKSSSANTALKYTSPIHS
jgi:hypothetical protein